MDTTTLLPHVNAALNGTSALLLLAAYGLIRAGKRSAHRAAMLGALGVSAAFLISYLLYHFTSPIYPFLGPAGMKPVYYGFLISHVVLALAVVPMIALTLLRALHGDFQVHRKFARWTYPVWLYVSATGILVYYMLYHLYPAAA